MSQNPNWNKSPLQREFEQSETYRALKRAGKDVMQGLKDAGITEETVSAGINKAAEGINKAIHTIGREMGTEKQVQDPLNPPRPQDEYYQKKEREVRAQTAPAPAGQPKKPRMEVRRRPSNAKFWITGAVCLHYMLNMPMNTWQDLLTMAAAAVGAFLISRAIFKGKKYMVPVEEPMPEPVKKPEPKPEPAKKVDTGNPEVDKIIEEGYAYLDRLKEANDRIEDEVMSARISRMEIASGEIFAHITEHPEKAAQIRRFMNYYLPTTLKLLNSYDQLSRQKVKGENIRTTMFEIEGMMETIAGAFETQLDSLFGEDAMDIAADISVMESILQQEGLSGSGKKVRGNAVEAEGPVPDLTFDPDDTAQP